MTIIFDIETAPLPDAELAALAPEFEAPKNYKDAEKIKAAREEKAREWRDGAALSAVTGRVLAIGCLDGEKFATLEGDELAILNGFWNLTAHFAGRRFGGHNILDFDLPFLCRRSWALGLRVPGEVFDGHRISSRFVDTLKLWGCGVHGARVSLRDLARALKVGDKTGSGADFAALYVSDRHAALAYLENDCRLTAKVLARLL